MRRDLQDGHGRSVRYLRLSITDRCNLRCLYCRSNAVQRFIPHDQVLRYEEMVRMVQVLVGMGVHKVRLTGGEPFVRKGCAEFLAMLHQRFPRLDLRVTTNGTLLEPHIPLLKKIGLGAVNLSLDSFDRETFAHVAGRDMLPTVLSSLDALLQSGIRVKVNVVAMRGINDTQMDDFVHAARTMPIDLRFIEFMPMGSDTRWTAENFWPSDQIQQEAASRVILAPEAPADADMDAGPARMFRIVGGKGRLGFISPLTNHFCATCNRVRLTSEGSLRTCLFADKEYPLRAMLRDPATTDAQLEQIVARSCKDKPIGAELLEAREKGKAVAQKQMVGIGG